MEPQYIQAPVPEKKPLSQRIQEKLAESRFLTFSLLLHAVLIVLAGTVVLFKAYVKPPDFAPDGPLLSSDTSASAAPPAAEPIPETATQTVAEPTVSAPTVSAIVSTTTRTTAFAMASAPMPVMKSMGTASLGELPKSVGSGSGKGLPGAMSGRAGGNRAAAAAKTGGTTEAEKAVMNGLRWLKKNQSPDGSWGPTNKAAMTGLAMLCFLGHNELPESPEFGETVRKGLDWMLALGKENNGRMVVGGKGGVGQQGSYEHGIATYAMGEYYAMTKDDRFTDLVKKAVGHIVDGQCNDGGWMYNYDKNVTGDTSVTGWQVQALKAAYLTGLEIPGVDKALDKSVLYMKSAQAANGSFGYRGSSGAKYNLTGVGVLCTYFWKQDKDKVVKDGIEFILEQSEKNYPVVYKDAKTDLYGWYYNTQACLMFGGRAWTKWNGWFQKELVGAQSTDGSWPPAGGNGHGNVNGPDGIGPFYRTTLCVLMLEVFYRYSPTLK